MIRVEIFQNSRREGLVYSVLEWKSHLSLEKLNFLTVQMYCATETANAFC